MTTLREAAQMALKALEQCGLDDSLSNYQMESDAVRALRTALAEQETSLKQTLTDPENQPNQLGVEFLMHGPKFSFKVGVQQFTLDYEPTEPGEFEFMRDELIHAFSVFTPDVKTEK